MAIYEFNTSNAYTKGVVEYAAYFLGDWPNLKIRYDWKFKIKIVGYGSWYINGCTVNFGGQAKTFNLSVNLPSGGTSGVLANGTVDIPVSGNGPTFKQSVAVSVSTALWSGSGSLSESLTIANAPVYRLDSVSDVTATGCRFNYSFTTEKKYWRCRIWNESTGAQYVPTNEYGNGECTVTGLKPNTHYEFRCVAIDRDGNIKLKSSAFIHILTAEDQLRIWIQTADGQRKKAKVWIKSGGTVKKVKAAWIGGRKVKGA